MVNSNGSLTDEHITLIEESKTIFSSHVTPSSLSSVNTINAIVDFSQKNITAVGADGNNVNTDSKGGLIRMLELHLRHT